LEHGGSSTPPGGGPSNDPSHLTNHSKQDNNKRKLDEGSESISPKKLKRLAPQPLPTDQDLVGNHMVEFANRLENKCITVLKNKPEIQGINSKSVTVKELNLSKGDMDTLREFAYKHNNIVNKKLINGSVTRFCNTLINGDRPINTVIYGSGPDSVINSKIIDALREA
jgi:hypothetical protein